MAARKGRPHWRAPCFGTAANTDYCFEMVSGPPRLFIALRGPPYNDPDFGLAILVHSLPLRPAELGQRCANRSPQFR